MQMEKVRALETYLKDWEMIMQNLKIIFERISGFDELLQRLRGSLQSKNTKLKIVFHLQLASQRSDFNCIIFIV
jgi:hypothetical protein